MYSIDNVSELFMDTEYVNFYPFVGEKYFSASHKILVLGESHYGPKTMNSNHEITNWIVGEDYLDSKVAGKGFPSYARGFDNTARVLADCSDKEAYKIYREVAFYNYFQETVGEGNHRSKTYLTPELVEKSRKALAEVLKILNPDLVIGWGYSKLEWTWLPHARKQIWVVPGKLHLFTIDDYGPIPFWCIKHPSSFFPVNLHRELYKLIKEHLWGV